MITIVAVNYTSYKRKESQQVYDSRKDEKQHLTCCILTYKNGTMNAKV